MPLPTSATRRLHDFLHRLHEIAGGNREEPIEGVLQRQFGGSPLQPREIYRIYTDLIELSDRALDEVRAIFPAGDDPDHAAELRSLESPVRSLRDSLISNSPKSPVRVILQHEPDRLLTLAATTSRVSGRFAPSSEELASVAEKLRAVQQEVLASDLPAALKEAFRSGIERLLRMVDQYSIFGPEGIQQAVGELTGQLSVRAEAQDPKAREVLAVALNRLADAVTVATGTLQLGQFAAPLLMGLLGGAGGTSI